MEFVLRFVFQFSLWVYLLLQFHIELLPDEQISFLQRSVSGCTSSAQPSAFVGTKLSISKETSSLLRAVNAVCPISKTPRVCSQLSQNFGS